MNRTTTTPRRGAARRHLLGVPQRLVVVFCACMLLFYGVAIVHEVGLPHAQAPHAKHHDHHHALGGGCGTTDPCEEDEHNEPPCGFCALLFTPALGAQPVAVTPVDTLPLTPFTVHESVRLSLLLQCPPGRAPPLRAVF